MLGARLRMLMGVAAELLAALVSEEVVLTTAVLVKVPALAAVAFRVRVADQPGAIVPRLA